MPTTDAPFPALAPGFHAIAEGHVAAIVTHLTMARPARVPAPVPLPEGIMLRQAVDPPLPWYRDLFRRVGTTDWLWTSRITTSDRDLAAILSSPDVEVHSVEALDRPEGLVELDFRTAETCELAFFGLTPALQGRGLGRLLMNRAVARAFSRPIRTLTVHTCTFDSPVALPFYLRSGFTAQRREVETFPDPRLTGEIARAAAPHVPIIPA